MPCSLRLSVCPIGASWITRRQLAARIGSLWHSPQFEPFAKPLQTPVERGRVAPERRMRGVGHHRNFSVRQARFVLVDNGGFDYRVAVAMHNQHRLLERRQEIIVVERA
jgi:hypothetical protein